MDFLSTKVIIIGAIVILIVAIVIIVIFNIRKKSSESSYIRSPNPPGPPVVCGVCGGLKQSFGYHFFPKMHSPGGTMLSRPELTGDLVGLLAVAIELEPTGCIGFDTRGNFKVQFPEMRYFKSWGDDPNHGLYVRNDVAHEMYNSSRILRD